LGGPRVIPESYATAWTCLLRNLEIRKGQTLVIRGATSVLGRAALNIAHDVGATIIATTRKKERFDVLKELGDEFGISKENVHINMAAVRERKREMVRNLVDIHLDQYKKSGAELVMGTGRFVGRKTVEVELADGGTRTFRGKNVVINTGTRATLEPIPGLAGVKPLTHIEALELDHIPKHLLVLGMTTVQMTMLAGLPYTALRDAVITHPTMMEGLIPLLLAVLAKAS
jgi:D-arabinose 1-dehydrogenase-like Zn-dependent alcohol dehydrogenase